MKRAAAKKTPAPASQSAESAAEDAYLDSLLDMKTACDGSGLLVNMMPTSSDHLSPICAADFRRKISEFTRFMHGSQFIGANGEHAFARNLSLLSRAWAAAIKFEQAANAKK